MSGIKVIGIGGAGGAIASYIHSKAEYSIPVVIIDIDLSHRSKIPPLVHLEQEILDSRELFYQFMDDILLPDLPKELIALTGFTGKKTPQLMNLLQLYCTTRSIQFIVTGVTTFGFQGRKKALESSELIATLKNLSITVYPFSNNALLSQETVSSALEDALKINYERIYTEVITPHFTGTTAMKPQQNQSPKPTVLPQKQQQTVSVAVPQAKIIPAAPITLRTLSQAPELHTRSENVISSAVTIGSIICAGALGISIAVILYAFGIY